MNYFQSFVNWAKRWGVILLIATIIFLFVAPLLWHQTKEKTKDITKDWFYQKTVETQIADFHPKQVCGVRPGERKFKLPHPVFVILEGDNYELTSYVRINDTVPNETFEVAPNGCVTISYSFIDQFKEKTIHPQVLPITFE